MSRVEALSGPQGTLYGASSESGHDSHHHKQARSQPIRGELQCTQVNSVDHGGFGYTADGMVNMPINDAMAIRIVAWDEHDAGYIDNVANTLVFPNTSIAAGHTISINNDALAQSNFNTINKVGARIALGIDLNSNWTITPTFMAQDGKDGRCFRL